MSYDLIIIENSDIAFHNNMVCGLSFSEMLSKTLNKPAFVCGDGEISSFTPTSDSQDILIIFANTPCVTAKTAQEAMDFHLGGSYDITVSRPIDYPSQSAVVYIIKKSIFEALKSKATKVYDFVTEGLKANLSLGVNTQENTAEFTQVTTPALYAAAIAQLRQRIINQHMENGVVFIDPSNVYIDANVVIGKNSVIYPNTFLTNKTIIGENCMINQGSTISGAEIADHVSVTYSVITDSFIDSETKVGPFAYIRPGTRVGKGVKVGDFVELKNSNIGDKTSISHLTYIGDSDVGSHVNFGCGTVTVNYDGKKKYRTTVGNNAFIGCNSNLISPVTVGDNAYIAAGSTITDEVPEDSLAIARARQVIKTNWNDRRKND